LKRRRARQYILAVLQRAGHACYGYMAKYTDEGARAEGFFRELDRASRCRLGRRRTRQNILTARQRAGRLFTAQWQIAPKPIWALELEASGQVEGVRPRRLNYWPLYRARQKPRWQLNASCSDGRGPRVLVSRLTILGQLQIVRPCRSKRHRAPQTFEHGTAA
jgi:hypothetical protein